VNEQLQRLEQMRGGQYKLVYVAPERFRSPSFARSIAAMQIPMFVIDEAHCISEWGHDFRPDYLNLKSVIGLLGETQIVALTATATRRVQRDIVHQLDRPQMKTFVTGFNRENLFFEVRYAAKSEDKYKLLRALIDDNFADRNTSGIVYCGTRRDSEEVAEFVRRDLGRSAEPYHAGLPDDVRRVAHDKFRSGATPIFAATNAFGMGVDKPDLRFVIHFAIPQSAEAYYQEAGRAGRDGQPAQCALIYCPEDQSLIEFLMKAEVPSGDEVSSLFDLLRANADEKRITRLRGADLERMIQMRETKSRLALHQLEQSGVIRRHVDSGYGMTIELVENELTKAHVAEIDRRLQNRNAFKRAQFDQIKRYAATNACRRKYLLAYFGERLDQETGRVVGDAGPGGAELACCDNCATTVEAFDLATIRNELGPDLAQVAPVILTCVSQLRFPLGRDRLVDLLRGSKAKFVKEWNLERNRTYGALAAYKSELVKRWIDDLIATSHLKRIGADKPVMALTPRGVAFMNASAVEWNDESGTPTVGGESLPRPNEEKSRGNDFPPTGKPAYRPLDQQSTLFVTLQLLQAGKSPEEVARERSFAMSTVGAHIVELIRIGAIELDSVLDAATIQRIESALEEVGGQRLTPIKEALPAHITWEQIRWVIAARAFAAGMESGATAASPEPPSHLTTEPPVTGKPLYGPWKLGFAVDYSGQIVAGNYRRTEVGELVYRFKYRGERDLARDLVIRMALMLRELADVPKPDLVVPVPPTQTDRRYDPVSDLAKLLADALWTKSAKAMARHEARRKQKEVNTPTEKRENVAGGFIVDDPRQITGKLVLLVDDFYDSGETLAECARALTTAGAKEVYVVTAAKTIHH